MPVALGIGTLIGIVLAGMCVALRSLTVPFKSTEGSAFRHIDRSSRDGFTVGETGQAASFVFVSFIVIAQTLPVLGSSVAVLHTPSG